MSPPLIATLTTNRVATSLMTSAFAMRAVRGVLQGNRGQPLRSTNAKTATCLSSSAAAVVSTSYYESSSNDEQIARTLGRQHCDTCTCDKDDPRRAQPQLQRQQQEHERHALGRTTQSQCYIPKETISAQLPPPLPQPKFSYHKRLMPTNLVPLSSKAGRKRFLDSLSAGNAEAYLPLAEQFLNQSDPAYCGVTTLAMVLNACAVDPNVRWRGGWRWYGTDDVVLDRCCLGSERGRERVKRVGISMEEFAGLGRCQGLEVEMKRPRLVVVDEDDAGNDVGQPSAWTIDDFRQDIQRMVQIPPLAEGGNENSDECVPNTADANDSDCDAAGDDESRGFLVVSFSRAHLQQTGEGHFSPVAAYHPPTDSCLILDVARFKYSPYWVSVDELYGATKPLDESTGKSRGWFVVRPPNKAFGYQGIKKKDEGMRPAEAVPLVGFEGSSAGSACSDIKIDYCRVGSGVGSGHFD